MRRILPGIYPLYHHLQFYDQVMGIWITMNFRVDSVFSNISQKWRISKGELKTKRSYCISIELYSRTSENFPKKKKKRKGD